jgi:hypothetical protein
MADRASSRASLLAARAVFAFALLFAGALRAPPSIAQSRSDLACPPGALTGPCGPTEVPVGAGLDGGRTEVSARASVGLDGGVMDGGTDVLTVFWAQGCAHCERARAVVARLTEGGPLRVEWVEVREDPAGAARFRATVVRLGLEPAGLPTFVRGDRAVVGMSDLALAALVEGRGLDGIRPIVELPWIGPVDLSQVSFVGFTLLVGLADGFNPCAFYVLAVLLGVLLHAGSRRRMALYGAIFVVMSGVVYFAFMSAWLGVFALTGLSRAVTLGLGVVLLGMGLLNLKDALWLGHGPSLGIPSRAKPALFRRMRAIARTAGLPGAILGITVLAAAVNLVELGCTLGLPAMYTRALSLRAGLTPAGRVGYLALYNLAYVTPLAVIVLVATLTVRKLTVSERGARVLKGLSGALLLAFGALFLLAPDALR